MTKSNRLRALGTALAVLAVGIPVGVAWAHWSITSQLLVPEPGKIFELRLHYEIMAGQANPDEALKVCFWLERHQANRYAPITGQACQSLTLKANDWRTLTYSVDGLRWLEVGKAGFPLTRGQYRPSPRSSPTSTPSSGSSVAPRRTARSCPSRWTNLRSQEGSRCIHGQKTRGTPRPLGRSVSG